MFEGNLKITLTGSNGLVEEGIFPSNNGSVNVLALDFWKAIEVKEDNGWGSTHFGGILSGQPYCFTKFFHSDIRPQFFMINFGAGKNCGIRLSDNSMMKLYYLIVKAKKQLQTQNVHIKINSSKVYQICAKSTVL